jgi:hypothetical protein
MDESFSRAMDSLRSAAPGPDLSRHFVAVLPISGAAVSTVGDFLGSRTLSASDHTAARLDELQFDLGEGPCWDAMRTARPVLVPDVRRRSVWPAFSPALLAEDVASIFAFPLVVGPLQIGAVDLYTRVPAVLDPEQTHRAGAMADVIGRQVLRRAIDDLGVDEPAAPDGFSRRLIHQATGMVLAQLDLTPDDARLVIQGHAFAVERSMMDVATDIIEGRLDFSRQQTGIEASE